MSPSSWWKLRLQFVDKLLTLTQILLFFRICIRWLNYMRRHSSINTLIYKVKEDFGGTASKRHLGQVVSCFLLREGADWQQSRRSSYKTRSDSYFIVYFEFKI
jgi:hypothetical protein